MNYKGFNVKETRNNVFGQTNISFIRIKIDDPGLTLNEILTSLEQNSWLANFDKDYLKESYKVRHLQTIEKIRNIFVSNANSPIGHETGEKVVSESARLSVVHEFNYKDIPLAELFKEKNDGNPGFDFYSENEASTIVLFGEAKYLYRKNAYNSAIKQINEFCINGKMKKDIANLEHFCSEESLDKANKDCAGYMAAFSCTEMKSDQLLSNIKNNKSFESIIKHEEVVLIAVEL